MTDSIVKEILTICLTILTIMSNAVGYSGDNLGSDLTLPAGLATYNISGAGVSSSATSITLSSLTIPQTGQQLLDADFSDIFYLTIEPGSRKYQEFVSCTTISSNTLSGCTRGLSPISPYTASTSLAFAHAGGSQVIFSNSPQFYNQFTAKKNDETITGTWNFSSTSQPRYDGTPVLAGNDLYFATVKYADDIANQGAATSTETNGGLVELATATETASSTDHGANKPIVLQAKNATSTYNSATAGLKAVITQNDGKIDQNFLDLSESFAFTASTSFSFASTTFSGVEYKTPTSQGASSTVLINNGAGILKWQNVNSWASTTNYLTAGTYTWTKPDNVNYVEVEVQGGGGGGGGANTGAGSLGGGGGAGGNAKAVVAVTGNVTVVVGAGGAGGIGNQNGSAGADSTFAGATTITGVKGSGGSLGSGGAGAGGAGGATTNADFGITGMSGSAGGIALFGATRTNVSGSGGLNIYGSGGGDGCAGAYCPGNAGTYGGGGGGAGDVSQGSATTGGAGGAGYVRIKYLLPIQ